MRRLEPVVVYLFISFPGLVKMFLDDAVTLDEIAESLVLFEKDERQLWTVDRILGHGVCADSIRRIDSESGAELNAGVNRLRSAFNAVNHALEGVFITACATLYDIGHEYEALNILLRLNGYPPAQLRPNQAFLENGARTAVRSAGLADKIVVRVKE